ncbi:MAG: RNA methyltransferase, partial [Anaerolineaceae bacterium]|nr:RNA methyltransferase [Anaerolineaceae bacterium]
AIEVTPQIMREIADTETPQGLLAIFPAFELMPPSSLDFVLILDNIRDPGNLGTLLRTAKAAGIQAVILTPGTADPFSNKVLRSGMGAQFSLPILTRNWDQISMQFKEALQPPLKFIASETHANTYWEADLSTPLALIIGSEAHGISTDAIHQADECISIPMPGEIESLNAATAGSILIYEILRQRSQ